MFTYILVYRTSFYDVGKCVKILFKVRYRYPAGCSLFFIGLFKAPARRPETDVFFFRSLKYIFLYMWLPCQSFDILANASVIGQAQHIFDHFVQKDCEHVVS